MVEIALKYSRSHDPIRGFVSDQLFWRILEMMGDAPAPGAPMDDVEEWHLKRTLRTTPTLKEGAARLGINPKVLWDKRRKYNIP